LDIKPGGCPNSFNRDSHGVLPAALLGGTDFDVTMIDVPTVQLARADGMGGSVGPHEGPPGPHSVFEDVATPFDGDVCDCHELGGDGVMDLSMKFKTDEVVAALQMNDFDPGALVEFVVTGNLLDGTAFEARDCVRLVPPGTPPGLVSVGSTAGGAWIDAGPLDLQLDGGGFADFERTYPLGTVVTLTAEQTHEGQRFVSWRRDGEFQTTDLSFDFALTQDSHQVEARLLRPGDFNGDEQVTLYDFSKFAVCFGLTASAGDCGPEEFVCADLDENGRVNLVDFSTFAVLFGR
jgi:hypothetical protein